MSSSSNVLPAPAAAPEVDCRCLCGSLLARVVEGGVELKCRRCKRTVFVPVRQAEPRHFRAVEIARPGGVG